MNWLTRGHWETWILNGDVDDDGGGGVGCGGGVLGVWALGSSGVEPLGC